MARKPRVKKSEAVEVRVSYDEKQAFMKAVERRSTTASAVVREAMLLFIANGRLRRRNIMISTTLAATAAGMIFLGVAAESSGDDMTGLSEFNRIDTNIDRVLSEHEFRTYMNTARHALSPESGAAAFGAAIGTLFAPYGDVIPEDFTSTARNDPDAVEQACWSSIEASWSNHIGQRFTAMDADANNLVSFAEFRDREITQRRRSFDRLDRNASGTLDQDEMFPSDDSQTTVHQYPSHITVCFGEQPLPQSELVEPARIQQAAETMMRFYDLDRNEEVSWDEYRAAFD